MFVVIVAGATVRRGSLLPVSGYLVARAVRSVPPPHVGILPPSVETPTKLHACVSVGGRVVLGRMGCSSMGDGASQKAAEDVNAIIERLEGLRQG